MTHDKEPMTGMEPHYWLGGDHERANRPDPDFGVWSDMADREDAERAAQKIDALIWAGKWALIALLIAGLALMFTTWLPGAIGQTMHNLSAPQPPY